MHLGVDVTRVKLVVYVSASVLTGLAVSVSGAIGYVGLLVPHVMRMLFGSDYRLLIPDLGARRRHRHRAGRYPGAHRGRAHRTARRRHDGHGRRARLHLSAAPEAGVSDAGSRHARRVQPRRAGQRHAARVRVNVEQASYAYAARRQAAPLFTLEATTFQARERELVAILGPNASGKSTLLRLIAGSIAPLSGRVELDGFETSQLDARTRAQRIALVQQESPLVFPMRAGDYVLQGRHPHGRSLWFESEDDFAIAENALAQVGAEHLRDRWMHEISGGEKQRVVLARALAQQPLVLLLDEPTLHLDIGAQVELLARLRRLADGESLHRHRRHARTGPGGGICRPDRAAAPRQMPARRTARRGLSARTARAGVRSAARDRNRPRGTPARPDPGRRETTSRAQRANRARLNVHTAAGCIAAFICRVAAPPTFTANSAFGKTV